MKVISKGILTVRVVLPNGAAPLTETAGTKSFQWPEMNQLGALMDPPASAVGVKSGMFFQGLGGHAGMSWGGINPAVQLPPFAPWYVLGTDPQDLQVVRHGNVASDSMGIEGIGTYTRADALAWRERVKFAVKNMVKIEPAPAKPGPGAMYVAGMGIRTLSPTDLLASPAFIAERTRVMKPLLKAADMHAENMSEPNYGHPGSVGSPDSLYKKVDLFIDLPAPFYDVQVGVLEVVETTGTTSTYRFVDPSEVPLTVTYGPNGGVDSTSGEAADVVSDSALRAMNAYDAKLNSWIAFVATPALPSTWPEASSMGTRPPATVINDENSPLKSIADTWWAERKAIVGDLNSLTTIPPSVSDAAFNRDVSRGYAGTRDQWNSLSTKPFAPTAAELASKGKDEPESGGFWSGIRDVLGNFASSTADVLKSWGGGGTAAVIGTTAVAKKSTNWLPIAAVGIGALLLLKA